MIVADPIDTFADPTPFPASFRTLPHFVELLPDAVWAFDRRDRITGWNREASRLYGLPSDAAVGQSVLLFVPHDGLPTFARACEAVRRTGSWAGDLLTHTATGEPRLVDARWVAAGPPDDPAAAVLAVHTDVTERRRREVLTVPTARWAATRALAAAVADEPAARCGEWLAYVRRFAHGPDPVACPEFRGIGDGVLVATSSPVARELTRALLDAAGYTPVTASDRYEAARVMAAFPDRVRAAVIGFGEENGAIADELRRFRPLLPVIVPDPTADAGRLLEAVAEAVATDRLSETELLMG